MNRLPVAASRQSAATRGNKQVGGALPRRRYARVSEFISVSDVEAG